MARTFWDGDGILPDDAVYFTTNAGAIVGRPYVRERARLAMLRYRHVFTTAERSTALARTIDSDTWLARKSQSLVASVCRDAVDALFDSLADRP